MTGKVLNSRYEIGASLVDTPVFHVFAAKDRMTGRDASIRILNPPFDAEAGFHDALGLALRDVEAVKHPGLERLYGLDRDEAIVYVPGDAVRGMPLSERIAKLAPFSAPVAISTAVTICEALASLHRSNVTHGDVGSHNITILPEGTAIVELAGVWKAYAGSRTAGAVVLPQMAPYLAPEISQGGIPTPASDVYGVGVILFELLTGKSPFVGDSPIATVTKHATEAVPSPRLHNANVPVAIDEMVKKCLAKARADRYPSAVELLSDLRMVQDALRFGRSLSWPILPTESSDANRPAQESSSTSPKGKSNPPVVEEERYSGDVPGWLKGVLIFFVSLVVFMIGAWVMFNLQKPKLVSVPDIRRKSIAEAEAALDKINLKLRVSKRIASEQYAQDTVIDSVPSPGTKLYVGGTVNVQVSAGSRFVEAPDLRGMSLDEARLLLDSIGLSLDTDVKERRDPDAEKGMVLDQSPEPRKRVERKTEISVTISSGKDRPKRTGGTDQRYLYTITIELSDLNEAVMMRVDITDKRGTRTISEQDRQPGEVIELAAEGVGEEAIFSIYYDGELVKTVNKSAKTEEAPQDEN